MHPHCFFDFDQGIFLGWQNANPGREQGEWKEALPVPHFSLDKCHVAFVDVNAPHKHQKDANEHVYLILTHLISPAPDW